MKKFLNKLLIVLFAFTLVVPMGVFAEGEEEKTEEKAPVRVYEFYGSTCGFCASLNEWFSSIEEEYGDYFDLVKLEVWNNSDNAALMDSIVSQLNISVDGVPFVVIGDKYTVGFDGNTTPDEILGYIMDEYEKSEEERIDIVNAEGDPVVDTSSSEEEEGSSVVVGIVFVVIVVGVVFLVIKARKED